MIRPLPRRTVTLVAGLAFAWVGNAPAQERDVTTLAAQVRTLAAKFPSFALYPKPEKEGEV